MKRLWRWVKRLFKKKEVGAEVKPLPTKPTQEVNDFTPSRYIELYQELWDKMTIRPEKKSTVQWYVNKLKEGKARYQEVAEISGVPWEIVGCLHLLETSGSFNKVLHNGETLSNVNRYGTRLVPRGRGRGQGWDWEDAAIDALAIKKQPKEWNIANTLYYAERYNGLGYLRDNRKPNSPYLWSFSNHYTRGKYISDGRYSSTAVSKQCGVAVILKEVGFSND